MTEQQDNQKPSPSQDQGPSQPSSQSPRQDSSQTSGSREGSPQPSDPQNQTGSQASGKPGRKRRRGGRRRSRRGGGEPSAQPAEPREEVGRLPAVDESTLQLPEAFAALGLSEPQLKGVAAMGFEEPSPIQQELIPLVLSGQDSLGQARTGTGKTAAFALPLLEKLDRNRGTQAIILTPTRELAVQVHEEIEQLARFSPIRCVAVYGGAPVSKQARRLGERPQIVVGTPGRVQDFINRGALSLSELRWTVLDEVDRMLDIGFRDDIRRILRQIPNKTQKVFVSATLPDEVNRLVEDYSENLQRITLSSDRMTVEQVRQCYVSVERWDKYRMLRTLLEIEKPELAIVFTNTKMQTHRVCERLQRDGVVAREIHGDLMQRKRDQVMRSFREQKIHVLVATDLMGRGIDVSGISHIINYDIPQNAEIYVHRIGRTARMGAVGEAISLVGPDEGPELTEIEKLINLEIPKREIDQFQASPPPDEMARRQAEQSPPKEPPVDRANAPVFADEKFIEEHGTPKKTLGSMFKAPQRRKLKRLKRR